MPQSSVDEAAKEVRRVFAASVRQRPLRDDLQLRYVVTGGMPGSRLDLRIAINPASGAKIEGHDQRATARPVEGRVSPRELDVAELFEQVASGLHSLVPISRYRSLPDALVGKLTIAVDGLEETFGFIPEEEKRRTQDRPVAPLMEQALRRLWTIGVRVLTTPEGYKGG